MTNRSLDMILGQQGVKMRLLQFISKDSIPHALLFRGMEGTGRTTAAYAFIRSLFCESNCSTSKLCTTCHRVMTGIHPDVLWVEPEKKEIKIEQARKMQQTASMAPSSAYLRFIVIKPAETMNLEASNALLKTLEEPTPHTRFILITSHPDKLLPTIFSRCQHLSFQPLADNIIKEILEKDPDIPKNTARKDMDIAAHISAGNYLIARRWLLEDRTCSNNLLRLLETLVSVPHHQILKVSLELSQRKDQINEWFRIILLFFHDLALYLYPGTDKHLLVYESSVEKLARHLNKSIKSILILDGIMDIMKHEEYLERYINPQAALENCLFRLKERLR